MWIPERISIKIMENEVQIKGREVWRIFKKNLEDDERTWISSWNFQKRKLNIEKKDWKSETNNGYPVFRKRTAISKIAGA